MHSALYHGWLDHRRLAPRRHAFRYRLFMAYLDLAELDEVGNTPWGEHHCYVLRRSGAIAGALQARSVKAMHVSPFHPMGLCYDWQLHTPSEALAVHMTLRSIESADGESAPVFGATLALERVPITGATLAGTLLRFPWMTAKVIAAIHWQALRLWLKRVPIYDQPTRSRTARAAAAPRVIPKEHA